MRSLKIAGTTLNQTPIDWEHNQQNIIRAIEEAKNEHVDLLCLPELCITGYGCEDLFLSEWIHQKAADQLFDILPHTQDIAVSVGLPVRNGRNIYNCSAFLHNGKILGFSAKQNLANEGVHYEYRWFFPWKRGIKSQVLINKTAYPIGDLEYTINGVKIGFEICEDAWTKDRPADSFAKRGIELIINPSASHFAFGKTASREKLIIDSSKKYNCTYLYTNLLGNEAGRMVYDGEVIIAKHGTLIARNEHLSLLPRQMVATTIDFDTKESQPADVTPIISKNKEFEKAVSLALFDYLRKSKSRGFVLSLSGGADSACCAVLVASMIKYGLQTYSPATFLEKINRIDLLDKLPTNDQNQYIVNQLLTCVYQSSKNSSETTKQAAHDLALSISATFYDWSIQEEVDSYTRKIEQILNRNLTWSDDDIAMQNIQARTRSPMIWMLANILKSLLITTSNRSEGDVGYATMDGDMSGSIAPIAAVDKSFIQQWLRWAEDTLGYSGLGRVNRQSPTAELRPSANLQTDEDDLMPYYILVAIEKLAIGKRLLPISVFETLSLFPHTYTTKDIEEIPKKDLKIYIKKFFELWTANQWKRERLAPSFHLDDFNVDPKSWCRFPILSGGYKDELEELANE